MESIPLDDKALARLCAEGDTSGFLPAELGEQLTTMAERQGADAGAWRRNLAKLSSPQARAFVATNAKVAPVQFTDEDFLGRLTESKVQGLVGRHLRQARLDAEVCAMYNLYGLTELTHHLVASKALGSTETATKTLGLLRGLLVHNYGAHAVSLRAVEDQVVAAQSFFWLAPTGGPDFPVDVGFHTVRATDEHIVKRTRRMLGHAEQLRRQLPDTAPHTPRGPPGRGGGGHPRPNGGRGWPRGGGAGGSGTRRGGAGGFFPGGSRGQ
jgi:hypothetical protein